MPPERRGAGPKLLVLTRQAALAAEAVLRDATVAVGARVRVGGATVERMFDREQRATHGLAWLATYVEAIRQLCDYAERLHDAGALGEIEELIVQIGLGEYLAQLLGGIPMSQGEIVRPADVGLSIVAVAEAFCLHALGALPNGRDRSDSSRGLHRQQRRLYVG